MPAEYEPHKAVWLGWSGSEPIQKHSVDVVKALLPHVPIKLAAPSERRLTQAKTILAEHAIDTSRIKFFVIPGERFWMRDHGATFLINKLGQKRAVDFGWTMYGARDYLSRKFKNNADSVDTYYPMYLGQTGQVDSLMAVIENIDILKTDVNMEGGSIEVNGLGTLILCEEITFSRNPGMSREYLEKEFKRVLGVSKIIWMKQGLAEDSHWYYVVDKKYCGWGTGGHTDEFVRFVGPRTILLAWVDEVEKDLNPINRMNYDRLSNNLKILENATDQNGWPFQIIKVPLPDLISEEITIKERREDAWDLSYSPYGFDPGDNVKLGDKLIKVGASSYLNYLVTNGAVLLPTYTGLGSSPEKEERVREIFTKVFPGRELIFLDVKYLNYSGGGIHCITQQEPE